MSSASQNPVSVFIVLIVLIVLFRLRRVIQGTRVSYIRAMGYSIFYAVFGSVFIIGSYIQGVPPVYFGLDSLIAVVGAYLSFKFSKNMLHFWKEENSIFVKGGTIIYITYIVGLIARLSIDFLVLGPSSLYFSPTVSSIQLTTLQLVATVATDILLAFGVGLLIGRNAQILTRYNALKRGNEQLFENRE